jgi:hypothetical protein
VPTYTLADMLAENTRLFVNCGDTRCGHSAEADVLALVDRLGAEHGAMHDDLAQIFTCFACREAGRDRRQVFFTLVPDYDRMARSRGCVPTD